MEGYDGYKKKEENSRKIFMNTSTLKAHLHLLLVALASTATLYPHTDKTYLSIRPDGFNSTIEYTGYHQNFYQAWNRPFGSMLQITPFYSASKDEHKLGEYFGIHDNRDSFSIGKVVTEVDPFAPPISNADLANGLFIHDQATPADQRTLNGIVSLHPHRNVFGFQCLYIQHVGSPTSPVFIRAQVPMLHVTQKVELRVDESQPVMIGKKSFDLEDFFTGQVVNVMGINQQTALENLLIKGTHKETGLGDFACSLGYKFFQKPNNHLFVSFDIVIPTGNKPCTQHLFQPVYGNGQHFGLGASLDAGALVWKNQYAHLQLLSYLRYQYLFPNHEHRVPSICGQPFSQYYLLGENGTTKPLFPAANVLRQLVHVKPHSMIDFMGMISFMCDGWTIDCGGTVFYKNRETVTPTHPFPSDRYGIASPSFSSDGTTVFNAAGTLDGSMLTQKNITMDSITTPYLLSTKFFGGLSYTYKYQAVTFTLVGGASYEYASTNADLEHYTLWTTLGMAF